MDTSVIDPLGDREFTNVKFDFCRITKEAYSHYQWKYTVYVDTDNWTKGFLVLDKNNNIYRYVTVDTDGGLNIIIDKSYIPIKIFLYMGTLQLSTIRRMDYYLYDNSIDLTLKELETPQEIRYTPRDSPSSIWSMEALLNVGYNEIKIDDDISIGFLLVNLVKTDFQFDCNQELKLGKVNKVALGVNNDYKPEGVLIGNDTPNITVLYGDLELPVYWDASLNDYCFDLDLSKRDFEGKIRFYVNVDANKVLNSSLTEVTLNCTFETINNLSKLEALFRNGGIGRLGADITLTSNLNVDKDILILGNNKTLNMNQNRIIVSTDKNFKAENTVFVSGKNTIQQHIGSTVDLTECTFLDCVGIGSIIDCQINISSLDNPTDFVTNLKDCTLIGNSLMLLHGGDLNIEGCTVTGGGNDNVQYPYFLYQIDGNATILKCNFTFDLGVTSDEDLEFKPCLFNCGEDAIINGLTHSELQNNNINQLLESPQLNKSVIKNTNYFYPLIGDNISLEASNGFCHCVSLCDTMFTTNVTVTRSE